MSNGYIRDPAAFDPTAHSWENDRVHAIEPGYIQITALSHPSLFEVFEVISSDNGGGAGHPSYSVPNSLTHRAMIADIFLARMSSGERETVGNGEESDIAAVMRRHALNDGERQDVDDFLNSFFEDWHDVE